MNLDDFRMKKQSAQSNKSEDAVLAKLEHLMT